MTPATPVHLQVPYSLKSFYYRFLDRGCQGLLQKSYIWFFEVLACLLQLLHALPFDYFTALNLVTKTSHTQNGVRTLKIQYFS